MEPSPSTARTPPPPPAPPTSPPQIPPQIPPTPPAAASLATADGPHVGRHQKGGWRVRAQRENWMALDYEGPGLRPQRNSSATIPRPWPGPWQRPIKYKYNKFHFIYSFYLHLFHFQLLSFSAVEINLLVCIVS